MRVYEVTLGGERVACVSSYEVAEGSLRVAYGSYPGLWVRRRLASIVVSRTGFDDLVFLIEPVDVIDRVVHL